MTNNLLAALAHPLACVTAALVAVLLLRLPLRRAFGPRIAYTVWALVPLVMVGTSLPAPVAPTTGVPLRLSALQLPLPQPAAEISHTQVDATQWIVVCWIVGCVVLALTQWYQQRVFVRRLAASRQDGTGDWTSEADEIGPVVVGVFPPKIVLPADFHERYTAQEQALVLAHERMHLIRRDPQANFLVAVIRSVLWFHPLVHLASRYFRVDQELACDAAVLETRPNDRSRYAHALLKTQVGGQELAAGCCMASRTAASLKRRIIMLRNPAPSIRRRVLGATLVVVLSLAGASLAWALQTPQAPAVKGDSATRTTPVRPRTPTPADSIKIDGAPAAVRSQQPAPQVQRPRVAADPNAATGEDLADLFGLKEKDSSSAATGNPATSPSPSVWHADGAADVTVLDADSIVRAPPVKSVSDLLEGRVPGLTVERTGGMPGDPARLQLRGAASPIKSGDPIVVVNGVRAYPNNGRPVLDAVDPNNIQTIEVLKGPSAVTLYGADAADGVIIITTKKAQP